MTNENYIDATTEAARLITNEKSKFGNIQVELSPALISLLSEQLYQSPNKAIEELVVNAYDADASMCKVYVPVPSQRNEDTNFIAIIDDGIGMDQAGLVNLWQIGRSRKREDEIQKRSKRAQIGKFGIGKLATYTIAQKLTYITKSPDGILAVTIDFTEFQSAEINNSAPDDSNISTIKPITLPVYEIDNWDEFSKQGRIQNILKFLDINNDLKTINSWTIAILEDLREKAKNITEGRLRWVLSTAMPLVSDFDLHLNGKNVTSSKASYEKVVNFGVHELQKKRFEALNKNLNNKWSIKDEKLFSDIFPNGVMGNIFVTRESLFGNKSDDIQRSNGFFVRVRGRIVDLVDPLFGMTPLRHGTISRFHADIQADNLDMYITASRDTVEESQAIDMFRDLLRAIFNEADYRYIEWEKEQKKKNGGKKESEIEFVAPDLVEIPVADALLVKRSDEKGTTASNNWFYIDVDTTSDIENIIKNLYTRKREKYKYDYVSYGKTDGIVRFDPIEGVFNINEAHDLVRAYSDTPLTRRLLEEFVTAEMALEAYMRESLVDPYVIGEILSKRDELLRALANDHPDSPQMIASRLRDSADNADELEINIVIAARAFGFTAEHISNSNKPDGIARFRDYEKGLRTITLEAKSSKHDAKRTHDLAISELRRHTNDYDADGCMLVATGYTAPNDENSAITKEANEQRVSCWTVEQLAQVTEMSKERHITASRIIDIVTNKFAPLDVTEAVEQLLSTPQYTMIAVYRMILQVLKNFEIKNRTGKYNFGVIEGAINSLPDTDEVTFVDGNTVKQAITDMASASSGAILLRDDGTFYLSAGVDELARRIADLTSQSAPFRSRSNFRDDGYND